MSLKNVVIIVFLLSSLLFRLFTNLKIYAVILFNFKTRLNLFISTMCSNLKSAGFSFGTWSINNVHIFNSLKKSCSRLLEYSMKRGMLFFPKKLGPSHQNLFSRNLFNELKYQRGYAQFCNIANRSNYCFYGLFTPCFQQRF